MKKAAKQVVYLLLTLLTVVGGYAYLRYAFKVADHWPFTQEIVLIILGTLATMFITALLLNQQSAVEIEKEQSIKFLDLKAKTYERLLDLMEEMATAQCFTRAEITKLQFITHRLAIFSSPEVLREYHHFLQVISEISRDGSFSDDTEVLSEALGELTVQIRMDLLNERPTESSFSEAQIKAMITRNSDQSSAINIA